MKTTPVASVRRHSKARLTKHLSDLTYSYLRSLNDSKGSIGSVISTTKTSSSGVIQPRPCTLTDPALHWKKRMIRDIQISSGPSMTTLRRCVASYWNPHDPVGPPVSGPYLYDVRYKPLTKKLSPSSSISTKSKDHVPHKAKCGSRRKEISLPAVRRPRDSCELSAIWNQLDSQETPPSTVPPRSIVTPSPTAPKTPDGPVSFHRHTLYSPLRPQPKLRDIIPGFGTTSSEWSPPQPLFGRVPEPTPIRRGRLHSAFCPGG